MELGLRGKRALVTGASRGIGAALAEAFAEEGSSDTSGVIVTIDGGLCASATF